ncbi:hypothetical protein YC2023_045510 [Brassica napus]
MEERDKCRFPAHAGSNGKISSSGADQAEQVQIKRIVQEKCIPDISNHFL